MTRSLPEPERGGGYHKVPKSVKPCSKDYNSEPFGFTQDNNIVESRTVPYFFEVENTTSSGAPCYFSGTVWDADKTAWAPLRDVEHNQNNTPGYAAGEKRTFTVWAALIFDNPSKIVTPTTLKGADVGGGIKLGEEVSFEIW